MKTRGAKRAITDGNPSTAERHPLPPPADPGAARAVKKRRMVKGSLKLLSSMPIDILFEIFGHLLPHDLLNLSRTTKGFRKLLMSKTSLSVWKQARANVPGLPDCASDLSEPQYAELAFGKACFKCGKNHVYNTVVWSGRKRFCTKCLVTTYGTSKPTDEYRLLMLVPRAVKTGERYNVYYDKELYAKWFEEVRSFGEEELEAWVEAKTKEREHIMEHAAACEAWQQSVQDAKDAELDALVQDRLKLVKERISSLGWQDELDKLPDFADGPEYNMKIIKICQKPLNPKAWKEIDSILNQKMELMKMMRMEFQSWFRTETAVQHLEDVRDEAAAGLPRVEQYVPLIELVKHPEVAQAVKQYSKNPDATLDVFDFVQTDLLRLHREWTRERSKTLVQMVRRAHRSPSLHNFTDWDIFDEPGFHDDDDTLEDPTKDIDIEDANACHQFLTRATIYFECNNCGSAGLHYPAVLTHQCAFSDDIFPFSNTAGIDLIEEIIIENTHQFPWNCERQITYNPWRYAIRAGIVKLCGHDPETATAADIETVLLECKLCKNLPDGEMTVRAMVGSQALLHVATGDHWFGRRDSRTAEDVYQILDEQYVPRAKEAIVEAVKRKLGMFTLLSNNLGTMIDRRKVCCVLCPAQGGPEDMRQHFRETHGSESMSTGLKIGVDPLRGDFVPPAVEFLVHRPVLCTLPDDMI